MDARALALDIIGDDRVPNVDPPDEDED